MKCPYCDNGTTYVPIDWETASFDEDTCPYCKGTGYYEVESSYGTEQVQCGCQKVQTNFERITANEETLAEFLADTINNIISNVCAYIDDDGDYAEDEFWQRKDGWCEWLKQESE